MTPQEQQLLEGLTSRVNQTQLQEKDPEAEQYLNQTLGRNPDAMYLMAQTVLVQQYALDQAKRQLDELKQQLEQTQQPPKHTSFLGSLLGTDEPRQAPPPPVPQPYREPQYAPVQGYNPQQQSGQAQYAAPVSSGGGFLRSAMQTATGVAAGAFAFQGIESLMHGFGSHAGYGGGSGFGGFGGGGREEIVNNYYGDSRDNPQGSSSDLEDRRDDSGGNDVSADTSSNFDDSTNLDDGFDDNSGSDDFGSDDSGGGSDDSSF